MFGPDFLPLPVHPGGALVIDLHAVTAQVAFAGLRIAGGNAGQGDEAASVLRPALQNGKLIQREAILADHFLARAGWNRLGEELAHLSEHGQHLDFVQEALWGLDVHERADAAGDLIEGVHFEREIHAARGAELVDEDLSAGMTLDVFKKQSGASGNFGASLGRMRGSPGRPPSLADALAHTVGNFGDLEDGIDFGLNFLQFAGTVQSRDPLA